MLKKLHGASRALACTAVLSLTSGFTAHSQDSMQTGDGLLMIKAQMPDQTRVGEQFTYNVEVINASDNVVLHDIKLNQRKSQGFSVESVTMQGGQGQQNTQQGNNKSSQGKSNSSDQKNSNKQQSGGDQQSTSEQKTTSEQKSSGDQKNSSDQQKSNAQQSGNSQSSGSKNGMTISMLKPGESRTFVVKASADAEGELRSCLEITSYTPAMCLTSEVVKPELELTKTAPKKVNRCEMIELTYTVKNGGSGDVGKFSINDSLGDGLATIEGESELSFPVDGLAAGETRKFVARVYAKESGKFSSRAVAKASNSDLKSRSKETTTNVIAADLAANVEGPDRIYGNDLARFTATITNTGNVAAESVNVLVNWPSQANLIDMSEVSMKQDSSANKNANQKGQSGQPTVAKNAGNNKNKQNANQKSGNSGDEGMSMQTESFEIDRLEPGQSAQFTYAIRTDNLKELPTKVEARYTCTVDPAEDQAKATAEATAMAMARVKVVRLPALQLAVVDDEDPVKDGSKVQYTIQVWNEGDAPDQNVTLVAKLPNNLEFDSANGPTNVESEGSTVKFAPIKTMQPGDRAEFTVTAKPTGTGNARFEAALTSEMLKQEVVGEEPTRLFDSTSN